MVIGKITILISAALKMERGCSKDKRGMFPLLTTTALGEIEISTYDISTAALATYSVLKLSHPPISLPWRIETGQMASVSSTAINGVQGQGCPGEIEETPTAHGFGGRESRDTLQICNCLVAGLVAVLLPQGEVGVTLRIHPDSDVARGWSPWVTGSLLP